MLNASGKILNVSVYPSLFPEVKFPEVEFLGRRACTLFRFQLSLADLPSRAWARSPTINYEAAWLKLSKWKAYWAFPVSKVNVLIVVNLENIED